MVQSTSVVFLVCISETKFPRIKLLTLTVTLPELIAQTNMNKDAVNHLRDEVQKITNWLARSAAGYFASAYEHPGQDYIENARRS